jgi:glycosyltransferase involved in cell wall biosynthesis
VRAVAIVLIAISAGLLLATWLGYPLWLRVRAKGQVFPRRAGPHAWWPSVTLVVVVRNAEKDLRALLQNLMALAYPADRRKILVVSDASDDFTDAIARTMAHHGVELLRMMRPVGLARATNIARKYVRSDVVVVVDPAARLAPAALAALVSPFSDASVGVTYGHEVEKLGSREPVPASPYHDFEAMLRDHETRIFGTVSARRTLYAMRGPLFHAPVSPWLSPDFWLALLAREHGYRALHVDEAEVMISRSASRQRDYARTVWAVGRDVLTLLRKPAMLDPRRYGEFSVMLLGHKVGRWLTPWALLAGLAGIGMLATQEPWARTAAIVLALLATASLVMSLLPARGTLSRAVALPGRVASTTLAIGHASVKALRAAPASQQARPASL